MTYQETAYQKFIPVDADGNIISIGGGSGGGGDASATNQQSQIAIETAIRDRLPSALVGGRLPVDGSGVTQPISASNLPLPSGAATDVVLQQVRDAIKAQLDIASTIWTDSSGAFYVRRDLVNEGTGTITVSFTDPSGSAATPSAGLRPLSTTDKDTITDFYDVLTSGTGYSVGDLLARVAILDANSGSPSATFIWLNLTTGTILGSAPTSANIERANENVGARQVGTWNVTATLDTTNSGYLSSINNKTPALGANTSANSQPVTLANDGIFATNFGAGSDSTATTDTGTFSLIALFKRLLSVALAKGQAVMASSISVAIASNQTAIPVTLPSTQVTPTFSNTSTSGTVAAGKYSVTFSNSGSASGTVLGTALPAGTSVGFTPPTGMTLSAIAYDATGTTFLIGSL
ncbi:MAG: hypothetical protein V7L22_23480 [Nostoc sp.]|uniref:hypothetical protein n=1 Tax=Nostoc sp. TaxID=1180 RepID=UPI002FF6FBA7